MLYRGVADFTLDEGRCPPWLFRRMVKLGREILEIIIREEGPDELVRRLADPAWFQSLGTVLAFDWNASGLTTVLTAALKEALRGREKEWGVFICGGKGKTSLKTPQEIESWLEKLDRLPEGSNQLVEASRLTAKVDSCLVQDGFQIYHHSFVFSKNGAWTVVQQGMNTDWGSARRYHWHSQNITDFVNAPHTAITSPVKLPQVLNLTAAESKQNRETSASLVREESYPELLRDLEIIDKHSGKVSRMVEMKNKNLQFKFIQLDHREFSTHPVLAENFFRSRYLRKVLWQLSQQKPSDYQDLLSRPGVGPKTIRALALVAEIIYGAHPSYQDPARYSFAHGGKDATPYPVDRQIYDQSIAVFREYIEKTKLSLRDKQALIRKLDT